MGLSKPVMGLLYHFNICIVYDLLMNAMYEDSIALLGHQQL
jgi:hypothetical protein